MKNFLGLFVLFALSLVSFGQERRVERAESILDRLEQRLMNREQDTLNFRSEKGVEERSISADLKKYDYKKGMVIAPRLPNSKKLDELSRAIEELEIEVENLSADVVSTKNEMFNEARINNQVELSTSLDQGEKASFRTLAVKLDGHLVYELNETSGIWNPTNRIPLYNGPMVPGKHKLEYEARLVRRRTEGLPMNDDIYHIIRRSFDFDIPVGEVKRAWNIALKIPEKSSASVEAEFQAGTIK